MNKKKIILIVILCIVGVILAIVAGRFAKSFTEYFENSKLDNETPAVREYSLYYNKLTYPEQLFYDSIVNSITSFKETSPEIEHSFKIKNLESVVKAIRNDRPDLFYVNYDKISLESSSKTSFADISYIADKEEIKKMISEYEEAMAEALEGFVLKETDIEKELAVNDFVCDHCTHSDKKGNPIDNTAYGALVNGRAFCDGYSYLVKDILCRLGINSIVVYGVANNEAHMWNMVEIDDIFYHLDVMWNDANVEGQPDTPLRFHGYFNLDDKEISLDHKESDSDIIPSADFNNNYYKMNDCYIKKASELDDVIFNQLIYAIQNNNHYIELWCEETKDNDIIGKHFSKVLAKVNELQGVDLICDAFRVHPANSTNNSVTIEIFYN